MKKCLLQMMVFPGLLEKMFFPGFPGQKFNHRLFQVLATLHTTHILRQRSLSNTYPIKKEQYKQAQPSKYDPLSMCLPLHLNGPHIRHWEQFHLHDLCMYLFLFSNYLKKHSPCYIYKLHSTNRKKAIKQTTINKSLKTVSLLIPLSAPRISVQSSFH